MRLRLLCALDSAHVLPFVTVGQAVMGSTCSRIQPDALGSQSPPCLINVPGPSRLRD
jgi:hypothetical protein